MDIEVWHNAVAGYLTFIAVEKGLAENSRISYQLDLTDFGNYCAENNIPNITAITSMDIQNYVYHLNEHDIAPATVNRRISAIRGFLSYIVREGLRSDNPSKLVQGTLMMRHLPEVLTIVEVEAMLDATSREEGVMAIRDKCILELMYGCGLRVSETIGTKISDFQIDGKFILVKGKGGKQRIVPVGEMAQIAINEYLEKGRPLITKNNIPRNGVLFLSLKQGKPMTRQAIWQIIKKYALLANVNRSISPHTLRHSFATHLLEGGAGVREVQELLGHASLMTTMIYTHLDTSHLIEVVRTFHPRGR